jgi:DNA-binding GntR family transcriptional regulator
VGTISALTQNDENTSSERRWRQAETRRMEGSICDRHLSPALRVLPASQLQVGQLTGAKAQVYNQLWRPLAEGRFTPGAKLHEGIIRGALGVSRPLVYGVLQQMSAEGSVTLPFNKTPRVTKPSPQMAGDVFETIGVAMSHVIRALAASDQGISAEQRQLIQQHARAQAEAEAAEDHVASRMLGMEFMILLAAIHGVASLTDLISRMMVLQTLSLKQYGKFPPPFPRVEFHSKLMKAIYAHQTDEAVRIFEERHNWMRSELQFQPGARPGHGDLATLLSAPFTLPD